MTLSDLLNADMLREASRGIMDNATCFPNRAAMPFARLFLSYSTLDSIFVDRLASDLQRVSVGVWYDKWEIRVGDSLLDKIASGIEENDFLALVLSPTSVQSEWVKREVNAALMRELSERKVVVLPLMLRDCELPVLLRDKKYADFRTTYEHGFEQLLLATSPKSPSVVRHSKEFRTAQYLISGLASTDDIGTNTLNVPQLKRIYPLRVPLRAFLGPEEKRLLFWSAAGFHRVNPLTPPYMQISTPVWGLTEGATETECANWTVDGLSGVLFEDLIPHYRWARKQLGINSTEGLKIAALSRADLDKDLLGGLGPISPRGMSEFLVALAEGDREFFDEFFFPAANTDGPYRAESVEATAWLKAPPDDAFYFSFIESGPPVALAAFRALVHLKRPTAVSYLRRLSELQKTMPPDVLDRAFSPLGEQTFAVELRTWWNQTPPTEIGARILASLGNAGLCDSAHILAWLREIENDKSTGLGPTLIRVLGNQEDVCAAQLLPWLDSNPVAAEAAVFGLSHLSSADALAGIRRAMQSHSETIVSAAIEAIAKADENSLGDIKPFAKHPSPMVRGSYYRALARFPGLDLDAQFVSLREEPPLVRLAASRALARVASEPHLNSWLDDAETDQFLRVCADEIRFAPEEFKTDWIKAPRRFDPELARLPVRLTDFDPGYTWLATSLDVNRRVNIMIGRAT